MFPFNFHDGWAGNLYESVMILCGAIVVLSLLGYLIFTRRPKADDIGMICVGGGFAALCWLAVIVGGLLAGLVLGCRKLVHGTCLPPERPEVTAVKIRRNELLTGIPSSTTPVLPSSGVMIEDGSPHIEREPTWRDYGTE